MASTTPPIPHRIPAWIVAGGTDRGRRRARNEDSFAIVPDEGIAVVADGMGGHPGGDIASEIAAVATAEALRRELSAARIDDPANATLDDREHAMRASVLEAHDAVLARSRTAPELIGMGTTTSALSIGPEGHYTIGNVGDSRVYLHRAGHLTQLTRDDTWLQDGIEAGLIPREEAAGHPQGHLLTQCVGMAQPPEPRIVSGRAEPGDLFLVCSDGLVACLSDDAISSVLERDYDRTMEGAGRAVSSLIAGANEAGGVDNITAVLLGVPDRLTSPSDA